MWRIIYSVTRRDTDVSLSFSYGVSLVHHSKLYALHMLEMEIQTFVDRE